MQLEHFANKAANWLVHGTAAECSKLKVLCFGDDPDWELAADDARDVSTVEPECYILHSDTSVNEDEVVTTQVAASVVEHRVPECSVWDGFGKLSDGSTRFV